MAIEAEANDILPANAATGQIDMSQFDHDNSAGIAAAQAIRADLGLPAAPSEG